MEKISTATKVGSPKPVTTIDDVNADRSIQPFVVPLESKWDATFSGSFCWPAKVTPRKSAAQRRRKIRLKSFMEGERCLGRCNVEGANSLCGCGKGVSGERRLALRESISRVGPVALGLA